MKDKAYNYLNRDRLHHIDMLETIDRHNAELIYAEDDGVLLLNIAGGTYMISTESEEALEKMCGLISEPKLITLHQAKFAQLLQEKYGFKHKMECFQCAYLPRERLEEKASEGVEMRELTQAELHFVHKNYDFAQKKSHPLGMAL